MTGGTRGIGLMIARGLVQAGVRTYVCSRKDEACAAAERELRQHGEAWGIPADLGDVAGARALAAEISKREAKLHILVNNAGATWGAPFDTFPETGWDKVLALNLSAVFFLTQSLIKLLEAGGSREDPARVINVGSVDGLSTPAFENYSYSSAKAGLHHLTRHLASHLAPRDITVNAIAPGYFATKMMRGMIESQGDALLARIPLDRFGEDADAAGMAIFLSSRAGSYVTGATIPLDGGYTAER